MLVEEIKESIKALSNEKIIEAWNEFAEENNLFDDDEVFENNPEFFNVMFTNPYEAVVAATNGGYSISERYVVFDGLGSVVSFDYLDEPNSPFDIDALAEWFYENPDKCKEYGI